MNKLRIKKFQNTTQRLNYEILMIVINDRWFKEKLKISRSSLEIPENGFTDMESPKYREWRDKEFIVLKHGDYLTSFITAIIQHYYLEMNLRDSIEDYIIENTCTPPSMNCNLSVKYKDNPDTSTRPYEEVSIQCFGQISKKEWNQIFELYQARRRLFLKHHDKKRLEPLGDIEGNIRIMQKSHIQKDYCGERYGDSDIAAEVLTAVPTRSNIKKNANLVVQKRNRMQKRLKELFPGVQIDFC